MEHLKHLEPGVNGQSSHQQVAFIPNFDRYQDEADDEIEIGALFAALKRRWLPLAGVTAVAFTGLMSFFLLRPPSYQRQFSMAVEPLDRLVRGEDSGSSLLRSLAGDSLPGLSLPGSSGSTDYDSLMTVLQSEMVLAPVVQAGQVHDPEFDHEQLVDQLTIEQINNSKVLAVSFQARDPDLVQDVTASLQETFLKYSTETQQMAMIRRLGDLNSQVELQRQEVARAQASLLRFQGSNQILDLEAAGRALEVRRSEVLVEQQNVRLNLRATVEKYNNLQNQLGLPPEEAVVVANLSESPIYQNLLTEYRELESQIASESARFQENTPIIQALRDKQDQLRPLLEAEALRNVGSSFAATNTIDPQSLGYQGSVGRGLVSELVTSVNEIQMLEVKDQSLSQIYNSLSDELDNLVNLGSSFREIERNLTLAEGALQALLASQQELELDLERDTNPWLIVSGYDLGIPLEPEDELVRNIVISLIASTILGLGAVFLTETLDRSYHDSRQVSEGTQLPLLGAIPWEHRLLALRSNDHSDLNFASHAWSEIKPSRFKGSAQSQQFTSAFYDLSTNLRLLNVDRPVQVLAVTSAAEGDGKTTIAFHLAMASAQSGRKVLLVDCQLRQHRENRLFEARTPSASSHQGMDTDTKPIITSPCQGWPLDWLRLSDDSLSPSSDMLMGSTFTNLLRKYRSDYDLIILDTQSTLSSSDTKLISQHADGLLLVVKIGETGRDEIDGAVRNFRTASRTPILGIVANDAKK